MIYPMSVLRNFDEILRMIDTLRTGDANRTAIPADWLPGGTAIIPTPINGAEARTLFPQGWSEVRCTSEPRSSEPRKHGRFPPMAPVLVASVRE